MLKKIELFLKITKTTMSGLLGVLSTYIYECYLNEYADKKLLIAIAMAIALFILISIANWVITSFINNCQGLRKLLLGNHFLEGDWLQKIAPISSKEKPLQYHIVHISYEKGYYMITGDSFNSIGRHIATFQSHLSKYGNHVLEYPFTVTTKEVNDPNVFGISRLSFSPTHRIPNKYTGVVSSNLRVNVKVTAIKLPKSKSINLNTQEGRNEFKELTNGV